MIENLFTVASAATEAHSSSGGAGIGALGLDLKALVFQIINFAILLFLLGKFAYPPIVNVLRQRREKIEESLKTAHEIEIAKETLSRQKEKLLAEAHAQVQALIAKGKKQADDIMKEARTAAQTQAEQIMAEGEARVRQAESELRASLRHDMVLLIKEATTRLIDKKMDEPTDEALIRQTLKEVEK